MVVTRDGSTPVPYPPPLANVQPLSARPAGRKLSLYSGVMGEKLNTAFTRHVYKTALWVPLLSKADDCVDLVFRSNLLLFREKFYPHFQSFVLFAWLENGTGIEPQVARSGAQDCRLRQLNFDLAVWTKQAAYTKQRRVHRVPISHEAVALIRLRGDAVPKSCPFLFPGDVPGQPVVDLKRFWERMRAQAEIPDVRIHNLRHTFASLLLSGSALLEMIGRLLGHTHIGTTQCYAHLIDSPLRARVNAMGEQLKPRLKVACGAG